MKELTKEEKDLRYEIYDHIQIIDDHFENVSGLVYMRDYISILSDLDIISETISSLKNVITHKDDKSESE